jgi:hypothetical protein
MAGCAWSAASSGELLVNDNGRYLVDGPPPEHGWSMPPRPSPIGRPYLLCILCIAIGVAGWAAGCGDDDSTPDGGAGSSADAGVADAGAADAAVMPSALRVTGTADGAGGGDRVECLFTLDLIDLVDDGAGGMSGIALGEVFRRTFDGDAPRFEFQALVGGPATLSPGDGDAVELRLVGDQPAEAVPFWLALEVMAGSEIGAFMYAGPWTCAPVLVDDPMDSAIEAVGTWSAVPAVVAVVDG